MENITRVRGHTCEKRFLPMGNDRWWLPDLQRRAETIYLCLSVKIYCFHWPHKPEKCPVSDGFHHVASVIVLCMFQKHTYVITTLNHQVIYVLPVSLFDRELWSTLFEITIRRVLHFAFYCPKIGHFLRIGNSQTDWKLYLPKDDWVISATYMYQLRNC